MTGPVNGQGALHALPAPVIDDPLVEAIRSLLPERSPEDRTLGIVRIPFGSGEQADALRVPVLNHASAQAWQDTFRATISKVVQGLEADDSGSAMLGLLTGATDVQLDLLEAFNTDLLSRSWTSEHLTDEQILDAFLGVTAAAFPFPVKLARTLLANRQVAQWVRLQLIQVLYSASTSSSRQSTDGRRKRSTRT